MVGDDLAKIKEMNDVRIQVLQIEHLEAKRRKDSPELKALYDAKKIVDKVDELPILIRAVVGASSLAQRSASASDPEAKKAFLELAHQAVPSGTGLDAVAFTLTLDWAVQILNHALHNKPEHFHLFVSCVATEAKEGKLVDQALLVSVQIRLSALLTAASAAVVAVPGGQRQGSKSDTKAPHSGASSKPKKPMFPLDYSKTCRNIEHGKKCTWNLTKKMGPCKFMPAGHDTS
jgi:hypothetical protein